MARNMYGATSADFTITSGGRVIPGAVLTLWTARTGGTQITDLLDVDSVACTTVTSAADGSVVYYGPNNDKTVHWADSGQGSRIAIRPVDITGDPPVLSIGTVTTGAAAANLTGTSESPVLNLTLPTAGANGVDTAAIQDKAVTAAKIADDTITAAQIAANAVGASELADNAVDTNAIADGAATPAKLATTGRFVFPTGAANGYGFASGAVCLSGTGAPGGVIAAAPGSTWLQTDSTTDVKGWLKWVKATGTGNTGWVAGPEADTGTRLVAVDGASWSGNVHIRRRGDIVEVKPDTSRLTMPAAGNDTVMTMPVGFRAFGNGFTEGMSYNHATNYVFPILMSSGGAIYYYASARSAGNTLSFTLVFQTADTWPSSLPGSAA